MKNVILFLLLSLTSVNLFAFTKSDRIVLKPDGPQHNHYNIPMPADMPDVYYNNDTRTITIDGAGEVSYYDVEIISWTTLYTVISTQVSGYYDTIDVSSLSNDDYVIIIYSPTGYTFDGDFEIY